MKYVIAGTSPTPHTTEAENVLFRQKFPFVF